MLNEKPTAEEARVVAETQNTLGKQAIIRTTMGDVHMKLFREECPRTVENFSVHARNGYYDNVLFHRVIKVCTVRPSLSLCSVGCQSGVAGCRLVEPSRVNTHTHTHVS